MLNPDQQCLTRLLDLTDDSTNIRDMFRLVELNKDVVDVASYVASKLHMGSRIIASSKTTRSNIETPKRRIDFQKLDLKLQSAVTITRKLIMRYL